MNNFEQFIETKKILVVDDEGFMRSVLAGIIKHMGCKYVLEARTGNEAWKLLEDRDFDLVFCDWEMPGLSGMELYQQMKENEKFDDVAFIMVTGNAAQDHVEEAVKAGVNGYIVKPFNENIIKKKMLTVLANSSRQGAQ